VLLITVDNLNYSRFEKTMPALAAFAKENVNFTQHMSSGNTADSGLFGCSTVFRLAIWTVSSRRVFPPR
jgi:membrane-anchored protein YejM (alkaline phosphatase superfamily)